MLSKRWQKIQKEVNRFSACLATLYEHNQSGATQQDMIANAKATYEALHQKKFNLDHAWVLLRHQPKWLQVVESLKNNSTSKTIVEIEDDNIDTEKRPLGNKAAKIKMKEAAKNDSTPISVQIQKLHEEKKERDGRKMELIKKKVEHDEQKLDLIDLIFRQKLCLWTQVTWTMKNDYIIPNLK
nr:glutathione S-transferase T3 [Malus domestica]